jgi:hypothetical protein
MFGVAAFKAPFTTGKLARFKPSKLLEIRISKLHRLDSPFEKTFRSRVLFAR